MTNSKLQELIKDFISSKDDSYMDDYYFSPKELADEVMQEFITFLNNNGVKVKLEEN